MASAKVYNTQKLYFNTKLKARLAAIPGFTLTVLEAPMGYGKTTAVRFAINNSDYKTLWHTVYADGVAYFWRDFCRSLAVLDQGLADKLQKVGFPADVVLVQKAVELISDIKLTQETVLVIDDYHYINSRQIDRFFSYLLANLPRKMRLVIMSRTAFLLEEIAGLRLKGAVNYIKTEDLLFKPGDIVSYCVLCGITISESEAVRLFAYSEGWITPLRLSVQEYAENGRFLVSRSIAELMKSTVYQPLSTDLKQFLNSICMFDTLSAEHAQYMWPQGDAAGLLDELLRKNGFITKDSATGQYSFHNLFISHAREAFSLQNTETKNVLWRRAGYWYLENGECIQAMDCFAKAADVSLMLMALATKKGAAISGEHKEKIIEYFDLCPQELLGKNLAATLIFVRLMISYNEGARLQEACSVFKSHIELFEGTQAQKRALLMEYERLLSLTKYNRIREMASHHRQALAYMDKPIYGEENKGNWTFGSPSIMLMFYRQSGRLGEHVQDMHECMPDYYRLTDGHGSGAEYVMEAEVALNTGDTEAAETVICKGLHLAQEKSQWSILLAANFVQARLALLRGSYIEMIATKNYMYRLIEVKQQYLLLHTHDICRAYLYLLLNRPDKIAGWISSGDHASTRLLFPALPALHIVYGRYLLLTGEYRKLVGMADIFLTTAAIYPNLLGQIYAYIYQAAAYHKLAKKDQALASLKQALTIALPDRVYLPFAEIGSYIADLLKQVAGEEAYSCHLKQIMVLHKKYESGINEILRTHFSVKPSLTKREQDVAILAAQGLPNRAIAETLIISENTVKARLKAIFEKLGIKSREQLQERLKKDKP